MRRPMHMQWPVKVDDLQVSAAWREHRLAAREGAAAKLAPLLACLGEDRVLMREEKMRLVVAEVLAGLGSDGACPTAAAVDAVGKKMESVAIVWPVVGEEGQVTLASLPGVMSAVLRTASRSDESAAFCRGLVALGERGLLDLNTPVRWKMSEAVAREVLGPPEQGGAGWRDRLEAAQARGLVRVEYLFKALVQAVANAPTPLSRDQSNYVDVLRAMGADAGREALEEYRSWRLSDGRAMAEVDEVDRNVSALAASVVARASLRDRAQARRTALRPG